MSKNDDLQKFSVFSEFYDGDIFQISEPLHLAIPWGPVSKSEKSMFYGPASLKSFKTSFSSFGLNKMTHGQISTYINGAFFGAPGVLQPKIPSKFE